jgi:predicted anti-sigma-YlaC factor YlaD
MQTGSVQHVSTEKLLLAATKQEKLDAADQKHLSDCEECRELMSTFARQNFVRPEKKAEVA